MNAYGDVVMTRLDDVIDGPCLRIDQADPVSLISRPLLEELIEGESRGTNLPGVSLRGGVLRVEALNRTVVYRIGAYLPERDAYEMTWPD